MRTALNLLGVLLILFGITWFLQGVNVLPGSFMTGQPRWAVYGACLGVIGLAIIAFANGRRIRRG
jgi:hypothetical protein